MTDSICCKLAVIGKPIAHSLSPFLFKLFANINNHKITYATILANNEQDFIAKVQEFFADGGYALNVTSPFKHTAFKLAKYPTKHAAKSLSSNLLHLDELGNIVADTTDGRGFVRDITHNLTTELTNKSVLILGSGYVVDSILAELKQNKVARIDILARNKAKVDYLMDKFKIAMHNPKACYDLIINASPNIHDNPLLNYKFNLSFSALAYDLSYHLRCEDMIFLNKLKHQNIRVAKGLGMLIEQARLGYTELFNKIAPSTDLILKNLNSLGYHV